MSHQEAARLLGVPYQALREASRKSESFDAEAYATNFRPLRKMTREIANQIFEMFGSGLSRGDIAARLGLSKSKVAHVLNGHDSRWVSLTNQTYQQKKAA